MRNSLFWSLWSWQPPVLLGCAALLIGYVAVLRGRLQRRSWAFALSVIVLLLALVSPLHTLGDLYLFSAHMLQHLLLLLIVPPLLLVGLPPDLIERGLRWPLLRQIERIVGQPLMAWSIGIGAMWLWHLPALYNAALDHDGLHVIEHVCFVATAIIFWWPVVAPQTAARLPLPGVIIYLFAAMISSGVLGIILTFAEPGWYPTYVQPRDVYNLLPILRGPWGLTPPVDQQLGGLLMWVPGNLAYLVAIVWTLARWYGTPEEDGLPRGHAA